jgi:uncharacterized membrane protein YbhN (UPF0104 family)
MHAWPGGRLLLTGLLVLAAAAAFSAVEADADGSTDLAGLARSVGAGLLGLRWPFALLVITLGAAHYLATALAVRAAAGVTTPLPETVRVQLAAAAANRLTPAGIGGSTLNARYLTRRGLAAPQAVGAVAALSLLGALADLVVLAVLLGVTAGFGVSGAGHQLGTLGTHLAHLVGPLHTPWLWLPVGVLALIAVGGWARRRHRARLRSWVRGLVAPLHRLARRPVELATLLAASAGTTLALAFAFAATTAALPGPRPAAGLLVLVLAYLLGAAVGNAVPVPAGLGSTEAALVALLVGLHVPAPHALAEVLVFRLITFWLPAALGLFAGRRLVRDGAL